MFQCIGRYSSKPVSLPIVYFDDERKSCKDTVQVQKRKLLLKHGNCCKRWIQKCQGLSTICHFYFHCYCALRAQIIVKLQLTDRQLHLLTTKRNLPRNYVLCRNLMTTILKPFQVAWQPLLDGHQVLLFYI